MLLKEIEVRHQTFDLGKTVKGCQGKRELRLRLMGLKASNLRDESDAAKEGRANKKPLMDNVSLYINLWLKLLICHTVVGQRG